MQEEIEVSGDKSGTAQEELQPGKTRIRHLVELAGHAQAAREVDQGKKRGLLPKKDGT